MTFPHVGPYLDRLAKTGGADFLVVAGNRAEAEEILRQARKRGLTMPVLGGDGLEGIEAAGALAEGVYLSSAYLPTLATAANKAFLQAYRKKFPAAGLPNQPAAATYDAVYLLRDVIARAGPKRQAVRRELARVGTGAPAFRGVTGTVAFDAKGDVPNQAVYIGVVRNGAVRLAGSAMTMLRSLRSRVIAGMTVLIVLVFAIALLGVNSISSLDKSVDRELSLLLESTDLSNGLDRLARFRSPLRRAVPAPALGSPEAALPG